MLKTGIYYLGKFLPSDRDFQFQGENSSFTFVVSKKE